MEEYGSWPFGSYPLHLLPWVRYVLQLPNRNVYVILFNTNLDSVGLEQSPRFCISYKLPRDVDAAELQTTLLSSKKFWMVRGKLGPFKEISHID